MSELFVLWLDIYLVGHLFGIKIVKKKKCSNVSNQVTSVHTHFN